MESYASSEPHNRPQTPRALSPMVTRCLPLGNPLEGCFCVHAYIHVYIYTCIILHQEERGECSSIESPSVVVLLTPLSLSSFLFLSFQSPHFFSIVISTAPFLFLSSTSSLFLSLSLFLFLSPLDDFDPLGYGQFFSRIVWSVKARRARARWTRRAN